MRWTLLPDYRARIMEKLDVQSAAETVLNAVRRGVIRQIQLSDEPASRLPLSARINGLCTRF